MRIQFAILCSLIMHGTASFGISEQNYVEDYQNLVEPFYQSGKAGYLTNNDGFNVAYRHFRQPEESPAIVFLAGRTESYIKYAELFYDLYQLGYSVYTLDHRGQGFSERMLPDPHVGWVDSFEDYKQDLKQFVDTIVAAGNHSKLFGIGQSMGGTVLLDYQFTYPIDFEAIVLGAPMLKPLTKPFPTPIVYQVARAMTRFGNGSKYAFGRGEYVQPEDGSPSNTTHSIVRVDNSRNQIKSNPEIILGGPSYQWVKEAIKTGRNLQKMAPDLQTPALLIQASDDAYVDVKTQTKFCHNSTNCKLYRIENSFHEVFQESDKARNLAISQMVDFFATKLAF